LLDVTPLHITGKQAEEVLDQISITTNKNTIPFDQESPMVTRSVRIGTAAVTTSGLGETDIKEIATIMSLTLKNHDPATISEETKERVLALTQAFPLYDE